MSTLTRYRTVVHNLARIYSAGDAERTSILKTGLEEILAGIGPITPAQWELVRHDSKCLLRVWAAREKNGVADTMVEELLDMMGELVTAPAESPKGLTPSATVVRVPVAETIHHVTPLLIPAIAPVIPVVEEKMVTLVVEELVSEEVEEEIVEEEEVVEEEEGVVEETEEEEEEEEAVEEEVLEPEAEEATEEEEAGMEVEQVFIRGRAYWLETNTQKLYAIVDEEDVGDEVGAMVNGKPQFLAAAK